MLVLVVYQVIGQEAISAPGSVCIMLKFALLGFLYDVHSASSPCTVKYVLGLCIFDKDYMHFVVVHQRAK